MTPPNATPSQAKEILRALLGCYPRAELDEEAAIMYARQLCRYPADVGLLAVDLLANDATQAGQFPALARVVSALQQVARRLAVHDPAPPPETPLAEGRDSWKNRGRQGVAQARDAFNKARPWTQLPLFDEPEPEQLAEPGDVLTSPG